MNPQCKLLMTVFGLLVLSGCQNVLPILDGATAACGSIHVEGYVTDSQGDVRIMKFPPEWTVEQVAQLCP